MKKVLLFFTLAFFFSALNAQNYSVSTPAGNGFQGLIDGAATTIAELYWPYGIAYDGDSIIFFSDGGNHAIRKLNVNTQIVTTIAGNGTSGLVDGIGSSARFNWPDDVLYKNGFLYIGDNMNNCIRKIDLSNNMVTTIAGTGVAGYLDGATNQAMFRGGDGIALAIDKNNDIYVADGANACIRKISNGQVTTIAGVAGTFGYVDGAANIAQFHRPRYLSLDTVTGNLYITDINNNVIRKLSNGMVSTFSGTGVAGGNDGTANVATFSAPVGIARTFGGYFYVIDGGGNKLRKVDSTGTVSTIAGNGIFGFQDGPAASAEFYYPQGVCYDKYGFIYLADRNNNRIRRIVIPDRDGVNTISQNGLSIKLYPNPTQGNISIEIENINSLCIYKIYNMLGEEIENGELRSGTNHIDMQDLPSGIYNINISEKNKTLSAKIYLQK